MTDRLREAVASLAAHRRAKAEAQPDLFSAIASVVEHAGNAWRVATLDAIVTVAQRKPVLTVEDLDGLVPPTVDLRALGGMMLEAQRHGYIRKAGWVTSGRERHGRPVREWVSLIFRDGAA